MSSEPGQNRKLILSMLGVVGVLLALLCAIPFAILIIPYLLDEVAFRLDQVGLDGLSAAVLLLVLVGAFKLRRGVKGRRQDTAMGLVLLVAAMSLLSTRVIPRGLYPLDCAEVGDARLATFPFDQSTEEAALAWIQAQYGSDRKDIRVNKPTNSDTEQLDWSVGDKEYLITLWNFGKPTASVGMRWERNGPTVSDALRCLGNPAVYDAYFEAWPEAIWTNLDLWYSERGLMFGTFATRRVARFSNHTRLRHAIYAQPGTEEELASRFYSIRRGSAYYNDLLKRLKPWPGNIRDVKVDPQIVY
ncbi:MAG: hypothetical protein IT330_05880 [Anaerolineae bacterium]|nr:hypothetical protein [Anaerolineae bacterium]